VDMLVENSSGELFIIEMQNNSEIDYLLRMLYGVSKAVTEQMSKGDRYGKIRKIYHINIIYFKLGDGEDYVYHGATDFRGIHRNDVLRLDENQKRFFMKENAVDLFPEYYILCVHDFENVAKDSLDEWMYYLKNTEIPDHFKARGLKEAREQLLYDNLSEEEKAAYDHHLEHTRYEQNVLEDSFDSGLHQGLEEGKAIGLEEGKAIGLEKGEAIGLEKGKAIGEMKIHKKIIDNGLRAEHSIEFLSSITGLSPQEVMMIAKMIKENINN
jgi:predicted transposase/invertase (TIGR01784 family)